ncbi:Copper chaperone CopZ [Paraliobacillus sp. PM-2]|uniref:copper chaperone CopZ n=1 Tax=Paraliobacillus sp. PM-2 TaxID=1462524 RepID=UPI00061C7F2E|nr:copper chaperone CopZ [Paraliobacillus sp. PM-2]CQR46531.1 Copper chaperone CopZ [Paraliobacillus sp. PM-2]
MKELTLEVTGMSCGHCKASVEGALNELKAVTEATVNLDEGMVKITFDEDQVTKSQLIEAIEEQGYDVAS